MRYNTRSCLPAGARKSFKDFARLLYYKLILEKVKYFLSIDNAYKDGDADSFFFFPKVRIKIRPTKVTAPEPIPA